MIVGLQGVKTGLGPNMENPAEITLGEQYAATIDWWRDVGVDYLFTDEIEPILQDEGLAKPQHAPAPKQEPEAEKPAEPLVKTINLPQDLAAFRDWWVGPDNPFVNGHSARLAPIGKLEAPIMVMTAMPELEDRDSLLAGAQGRLVGSILRAIGIDPNATYLASALPCHTSLPDWGQLGTDGLGAVLAHHIALAKPRRVLLMGSKLPALLGQNPAALPESFSTISGTATLSTFSPDRLLDHPRQRARLWKRLCQWTATA